MASIPAPALVWLASAHNAAKAWAWIKSSFAAAISSKAKSRFQAQKTVL
jgi:hypothetical protein